MGLIYEELQELLKYIEEHHSWKNMFENHMKNGKAPKIIKYVNFSFDTRDCDIWWIKLDKQEFRTEQGYNLKEEVYKWLKS